MGIDLGDKYSQVCALDGEGEVVDEGRIRTTPAAFERRFGSMDPVRVALEVGTHSPWLSRLLEGLGHEVLVANARKLRLIYENDSKDDRVDAEMLARVARMDPKLLHPIRHRGAEAQKHLELIRARHTLVRTRTTLINHVRGAVKARGSRLPKCDSESFHHKAGEHIPWGMKWILGPMVSQVGELTKQIRGYDRKIKQVATEKYPETERLQQVVGVGPLTALAFVLTIEDPSRFPKSRTVGAYLGLRPKRSDSGEQKPQLRITKAGDSHLRSLLVGAAQYILGPFGRDCRLRRWGLARMERGGKSAKKKSAVAVARKLSVLLHSLWKSGEDYDPFRGIERPAPAAGSAE
jgi:transposase